MGTISLKCRFGLDSSCALICVIDTITNFLVLKVSNILVFGFIYRSGADIDKPGQG